MYRRRRLVLLLALLLVIAGVVLAILRPWEGSAAPAPEKSTAAADAEATQPAATPKPDMSELPDSSQVPPAEGAPVGEVQPCTAEQVTVTPATDKQAYAAAENPQLTVTLANVSGVDCSIDAGTAAQVFEISSGSEVYWRSTDCQAEPANQVVTLAAGQQVPSAAPLTWDRTRSSAETCDSTDRPAAPAGGASYHLTVTVGGMKSSTTSQFILN